MSILATHREGRLGPAADRHFVLLQWRPRRDTTHEPTLSHDEVITPNQVTTTESLGGRPIILVLHSDQRPGAELLKGNAFVFLDLDGFIGASPSDQEDRMTMGVDALLSWLREARRVTGANTRGGTWWVDTEQTDDATFQRGSASVFAVLVMPNQLSSAQAHELVRSGAIPWTKPVAFNRWDTGRRSAYLMGRIDSMYEGFILEDSTNYWQLDGATSRAGEVTGPSPGQLNSFSSPSFDIYQDPPYMLTDSDFEELLDQLQREE